jgi:hypothetical protein
LNLGTGERDDNYWLRNEMKYKLAKFGKNLVNGLAILSGCQISGPQIHFPSVHLTEIVTRLMAVAFWLPGMCIEVDRVMNGLNI